MKNVLVGFAILGVVHLSGACDEAGERYGETPVTLEEARWNAEARYQAMMDNALISDMSVADIHFVPHTTVLNSLGEQRLQRYADLLMYQGGTLYLETASQDEAKQKARIASVQEFLASAGIEDDRLAAEIGIRAGHGIAAVEAIQVKQIAFSPERQSLTDMVGGSGGGFGTGG